MAATRMMVDEFCQRPTLRCQETAGRPASGTVGTMATIWLEQSIAGREEDLLPQKKCERSSIFFARQCFCGNALPKRARKLPKFSCNMKCTGNKNEKCGGLWKISVFRILGGLGERLCKFLFLLQLASLFDYLSSFLKVARRTSQQAVM